VVFETRRHVYPVYVREPEEIKHCFSALVSRYKAARSDPRFRLWFAFKNLGRAAGGSLEHEHFQTYSLPFIPPSIERRYARAAEYFKQTGESLYRRVFETEASSGDRLVSKTAHFVTYVPFAASMPYELCIAPLRNSADFSRVTDDELLDLATSFRDAVSRLNSVHPELAYNVALHSAAFEHEASPWYCWHLEIFPRLSTLAGMELGVEIKINSVNPETAAASLRSVAVQ
jgi:UDPglucose--hexose-1-phosphate uridylyltransferase